MQEPNRKSFSKELQRMRTNSEFRWIFYRFARLSLEESYQLIRPAVVAKVRPPKFLACWSRRLETKNSFGKFKRSSDGFDGDQQDQMKGYRNRFTLTVEAFRSVGQIWIYKFEDKNWTRKLNENGRTHIKLGRKVTAKIAYKYGHKKPHKTDT